MAKPKFRPWAWCAVSATLLLLVPAVASADDEPLSETEAVLRFDLPAGSRIVIEGDDYGTKEIFRYKSLKPDVQYAIEVEVHLPGGRTMKRTVEFRGGQTVRQSFQPETGASRSAAPPKPPVAVDEGKPASQRWALLIGVNEYQNAAPLRYCSSDMVALRDQLVASGFDKKQVFLLHDKAKDKKYLPFKANIQRQLDLVLGLVERDDMVVVAFSGHGVEWDGQTYLCPTEAQVDDRSTLISLGSVYDRLKQCRGGFKLVLVDACRNDPRNSGRKSLDTTKRLATALVQRPPEGIVLLTSCRDGEISMEDEAFGHGVFMHYLLEGLHGKADANQDQRVTLGELSSFAGRNTKIHVARKFNDSQRPSLIGDLATEALDFDIGRVMARADVPLPLSQGQVPPRKVTAGPTIKNSIGMKLTLIPAGEFMMGSRESAEALAAAYDTKAEYFQDERPWHRVRITKPFYLGTYEVTLREFLVFYHDTHYEHKWKENGGAGTSWTGTKFDYSDESAVPWSWGHSGQTQDHPVVNVSWHDAVAFCQWLSRKEGKLYRLPTEAEWEYACRAGAQTRYYQGDDDASLRGAGNVCDYSLRTRYDKSSWTYASWNDGYPFTAPVGKFAPNDFGLYDMEGNVWEWCQDWYDENYYVKSPIDDPPGAGAGKYRVDRGGSWASYPWDCRAAGRDGLTPSHRDGALGFRVALVLPGE